MRALRKALVALIVAALIQSSGGLAGVAVASTPHHSAATPHATRAVQAYADLAIEPADEGCINLIGITPDSHDGKTCNQCCGMCIAFNLVLPTATEPTFSILREQFLLREAKLSAPDIPTDPGIPKSL